MERSVFFGRVNELVALHGIKVWSKRGVSNNGPTQVRSGQISLHAQNGMHDLLFFAVSKENLFFMLEELSGALQEVSLVLNASKTFVLTTEAQPPTSLRIFCTLAEWGRNVGDTA